MSALIRLATEGDLPAIVAIYNESIPGRTATADLEPVTVAQREAWFRQHTPEAYPLWVYEINGEVAGWTSLSPFHSRLAYRKTAEVSTYIGARFQGQGIGSALREHVLAACPALGIETLVSLIFGHNAASIALNEKFGFERWGHLPRVAELDGVERDLIIMGRRVLLSDK
jgi:phosphinothricin acetyltransferase